MGGNRLGIARTEAAPARRYVLVAVIGLAALATACAGSDLEVVAGPDPDQTASTTDSGFDSTPSDEDLDEDAGGSTTNAVGPEETSSSSSSSSTTTTEPDEDTTSTTPTTSTPSTDPPPPGEAPDYRTDADAAARSVAFVNDKRGEHGVRQLQVDPDLVQMAEDWAYQMARDEHMRHNPNLQSQVPDRYWGAGENVAYGFDADGINLAWWNSEGHRNNILSGDYSAIGVAFVIDPDGEYWAVQVFGAS